MAEQRLIDANYIVEVAERAWDAWNLAMATQDTIRGVNKVIKRQELCKAVKAVTDDAPTIDPETLPVVQQLREELKNEIAKKEICGETIERLDKQLEKVTAERDVLLKELAGECGVCLHYEDCIKNHYSCCDGSDWEYCGPKKEDQ